MFIYTAYCYTQDIHWSMQFENPIYQNPCNSGLKNSDFRVSMNYRNQWKSVTKSFNTFSLSCDKKINTNNRIGVGAIIINDDAGDGKLKTLEIRGNVNYTLYKPINERYIITIGIDIGLNYRKFNFEDYKFESQYNGLMFQQNLPSNEAIQNNQKINAIIGSGIKYDYIINAKQNINIGYTIFNINKPNQGFYGVPLYRDRRHHVSVNINTRMNKKIKAIYTINLQHQLTYNEVISGLKLNYNALFKNKQYTLCLGLYNRNKDAIICQFGISKSNWIGNLSYDINYSSLSIASKGKGASEISIQYLLKKQKTKINQPTCTDFY